MPATPQDVSIINITTRNGSGTFRAVDSRVDAAKDLEFAPSGAFSVTETASKVQISANQFDSTHPGLVPSASGISGTKYLGSDGQWHDGPDMSGYYTSGQVDTLLGGKVDTVQGKGLSTNDYTTADRDKLANIQNRAASQGGLEDSLVTTGDKYAWSDWETGTFIVPPAPVAPDVPHVTIGGRDYSIVQVGDRWWMAENLKYDIGSASDMYVDTEGQAFVHPDSAEYVDGAGEYYYRIGYIRDGGSDTFRLSDQFGAIVPEGWRFPTYEDMYALSTISGEDTARNILTEPDGTDLYGYGATPCKLFDGNGEYPGSASMLALRYVLPCAPEQSTGTMGLMMVMTSGQPSIGTMPDLPMPSASVPVRFCKDA